MIQRLFVYGTLAPGRPNEHVLREIGGSFVNVISTRHVLCSSLWLGQSKIEIEKKTFALPLICKWDDNFSKVF